MAYENETIEQVFIWLKDKASELYSEIKMEVFDERAFADSTIDTDGDKILSAVHIKSSSTDTKMTLLEMSISLLSEKDDFDKAVEILSAVVEEHNLKTISKLGGYVVFNTPYVSSKFVEHEDSYRAELSVDGSFIVSPAIQNTTLEVDGESVFLLQSAIGLSGSNDPVVLASTGLAKSQISYYTRTFTIKVYNDLGSAFIQKCYELWSKDTLNPSDIVFSMTITYGDGFSVTKKMYLQQLINSSALGSIATLDLVFVEADV